MLFQVVHGDIYVCVCVYIYIYIHACIYIYIYTQLVGHGKGVRLRVAFVRRCVDTRSSLRAPLSSFFFSLYLPSCVKRVCDFTCVRGGCEIKPCPHEK